MDAWVDIQMHVWGNRYVRGWVGVCMVNGQAIGWMSKWIESGFPDQHSSIGLYERLGFTSPHQQNSLCQFLTH